MRILLFGMAVFLSSEVSANDLIPVLTDGPKVRRHSGAKNPQAARRGFLGKAANAMQIDAQTGLLEQIKFDTQRSQVFTEDNLAAEVADHILANHGAMLGLQVGHLGPMTSRDLSSTVRIITWPLQWAARIARHSHLEVGLARTGGQWRLRHIMRRGGIPAARVYPEPSRASDLANLLPQTEYTIKRRQPIFYESGSKFIAATLFTLEIGEELFDVTVNDESRTLEEAYAKKVSASVLRAQALSRSYLDEDLTSYILPFTQFLSEGMTKVSAGNGAIDDISSVAQISLANPRVQVFDRGAAYQINSAALSADGAVITEGNDFLAMNTYLAINRLNRFVRQFIASSETLILGATIRVNINVAGSCNAFYNGAISLFSAGDGCANMAEVNDVIYHEWGHGLDDFTGRSGGIVDGAFSEGIGDIVAAYFVDSSNMGQGFFEGNLNGIRNLDNSFRYPEDQGAVHDEGRIIGGAFWDLRQGLIGRYGKDKGGYLAAKYFFRHLLVADAYLESYEVVLAIDDDDGNPATQSPNHCLINEAFAAHGLASDEGCTDPSPAPELISNNSIVLGIINEDGQGGVELVASHPEELGDGIVVCTGLSADCATPIVTSLDGYNADQSRLLYRSADPVSLGEHTYVTLGVKSGSALKYKRSFKLVTQ